MFPSLFQVSVNEAVTMTCLRIQRHKLMQTPFHLRPS
ncbi:hypothetical protein BofuT4_uP050920.1 [Botrytis cinerea T4]|uniref:Uncharacterized protein n=1 Tax=Botryotinia fuckeliana (strain T4) TaxID=999810 RepID=G2XWZ6_BOTF4|nr:hypothetical protein BofuT4_uP050920.1 [Botrytis cinerea T4]